MNSRQRVLTAFGRAEPDRVPINYMANPDIDRRLKAHFGLAADDAEGLRQALGVDFRGVGAPYAGPRLHAERPRRRVDPEWGRVTRWIEHGAGGYWDFCDFPLRDADEETIAAWPMPSPEDYDYSGIAERCRAMGRYAVYAGHAGVPDVINATGMVRGMEQVLIDLLTGDGAGLLLIDRRLEIQLEVLRRTLEAARGGVSFLWLGEDLGTQIGPLISPQVFREQIRPRHQRFIDLARAFDLPVMIHSCGSSSWAFDDFIAMGIGVVDTLQPEAKDMAPAYLKRRYGGRLAFHGCISTGGPVAFGTAADTIADVRATLETMMPGGGYCFSPTHALQDNSPTENVVAMYDAARQYGTYGKG
ncbi:MAG: hypothetical protein GX591_07300 [Planctomycetes bacterium]|nr:hypothetical protein [Planctomycetota bacterium]